MTSGNKYESKCTLANGAGCHWASFSLVHYTYVTWHFVARWHAEAKPGLFDLN
jgi:hypothetical protein